MSKRGQRADRRVKRGVAVDDGRCGADGLAFRLAGQRHEPAHGLSERVEGGPLRVRPVLTEPRHGDEDDPGIQRGQPLVVEAHGAHDAGTKVFEHDVGLGHEGGEDFLALGLAEIETDALLAAVVDGEVDALTADEGRVLARLLAARRLDLDHLGAQV